MLSGRQAHQILARCIVDTTFLEQLERDPDRALESFALGPDDLDRFRRLAPKIAKYAGLIATVQSNGLWTHIPATRLLLKRNGLDLQVFTAFRNRHQQNRATVGMNHEAVTLSFFAFFDEEILTGPVARDVPFLADMFRHERTIWDLHRVLRSDSLAQAAGAAAAEVPELAGDLLTVRYGFDPLAVRARLLDRAQDLTGTPETTVAYLRDLRSRQVRVLEITEAMGTLLARIDGKTRMAPLVAGMATRFSVAPQVIEQALGELARAGLVRLPDQAAETAPA